MNEGRRRGARGTRGDGLQARLRLTRVQRLAAEAALPDLREFVLPRCVLLYAHSSVRAVLLAVKHQRQLVYSV
jgi:hypothetical protein